MSETDQDKSGSPPATIKTEPWQQVPPVQSSERFTEKAMQFHWWPVPRTLKELARYIWNADVFFGPIPFLKCLALASLLLSSLIAWLRT